jgi:hypothetical protein
MFHGITLRLPAEYQRRGPQYPGVAFFQGEGEWAEPFRPAGAGDPFAADVAAGRPHPRALLRTDILGGQFALLWLSEAELAAGPTPPPPDSRRPGEHQATDQGPNAWDERQPTVMVYLTVRDDPNAGLAPTERADTGYLAPFDVATLDWHPWAQALAPCSHLGGTAFPCQLVPEGLTPYYLELDQLPGLNFGNGNAQIDLESDTFDWACD